MSKPLTHDQLVGLSEPKVQQLANRKLLCEALRSGKYKQTYARFVSPGPLPWSKASYCPIGLAEKLGICSRRDFYPAFGILVGAVYVVNDTRRMTFPEIADWIDARP